MSSIYADEASRFHLGCQRQHSVVICSGALLFSSRVLRPSLVTLCTKLNGGLFRLHSADEDAVSWLTSYVSLHAYENKKK